ncbi:uridine kinase family-domain-containing protein [Jimgerdemannia flammicorona]|uniref:uridine/cytidine kinase n=1 Tax=Jimgerdemannia flammicorona TaxID=994334 RepID=A0A433CYE9_9FUNG|nr:uridine kinase family-domain-containing protein [Jimgerdemannia flammicorona]
MDSYYKVLTPEEKVQARAKYVINNHNFDHPSAFDHDILFEALAKLKKGKSVEIPIYNFATHSRETKTKTIYGANVIIFEGIFALYDKKIMELMDLKIFVDTDADIRLARRLKRDISERGRDVQGVLQQYTRFVKSSFDDYIKPTLKNADVIIPRGLENAVAIDLITKHIQRQLKERLNSLRWDQARMPVGEALPETVVVLEPTNQIKGIHTILRDHTTSRDDFIFYAERLSTLVIERSLAELPFDNYTVTTPVNVEYHGKKLTKQARCIS